VIARYLLALLAHTPVLAIACDPGEGDAPYLQAMAESRYVFLGIVGPTERIASQQKRFGSVIAANITIVESYKGELRVGDFVPMRLGQPRDSRESSRAFAWLGDRVLIYASSLPVTEETFNVECGTGSDVVGDSDRPNLDHYELEVLRRLSQH
jgi:hypothetical protein